MMDFKAVVFDLDGTLVDSPLSFVDIRKELEIPEKSYILEHLDTVAEPEKTKKLKRLEEIEVEAAGKAAVFPGVIELIQLLHETQARVGIFTRNCRAATTRVVETLGLDIHMIVTREDAPAKPDPEGLQKFLTAWDIEKQDLLYIGDFHFDIDCGKALGVKTGLFTNGLPAALGLEPDLVIVDYRHFLDELKLLHR